MLPGFTPNALPPAPSGAYQIAQSLRFRMSASTYLSRTQTAGDRQKFTHSAWVKRGGVLTPTLQVLFDATVDGVNRIICFFANAGQGLVDSFGIFAITANTKTAEKYTTATFRDPAAFMHIVLAWDTTQAVAANRVRLYVNNVELPWPTITVEVAQNALMWFNAAGALANFGRAGTADSYFDGYMSEVYCVDGQQLTPSSFGQLDAATNTWVPKKYAGALGANGCYLKFSDNSSVAALGTDFGGSGNNYTPTNFSVTAGVTNDSLADTPNNNYCTFNPVVPTGDTYSDANLKVGSSVASTSPRGTHAVPLTGKWYWEVTPQSGVATHSAAMIGICNGICPPNASWNVANAICYFGNDGTRYYNNVGTAYGASYDLNDVIGVMVDSDANTLTFYKNGVSQGALDIGAIGMVGAPFFPVVSSGSGIAWTASANFGQRPFFMTPGGAKALCTQNFPDPVIKLPAQYFDINLRTATGAAYSVTGKAFQPDLAWIKSRSAAINHALYDAPRAVKKELAVNTTAAEVTANQGLMTFDAAGYSGGNAASINTNAATYVEWLWKEAVLPGLDVVTVASASAAAVSHGLGVKPAMIIVKSRTAVGNWQTTHRSLGNGVMQDNLLVLNSSAGAVVAAGTWGGEPTATQFFVGNSIVTTAQGYVAYLFAEVPGFSRFNRYVGNSVSGDGSFVWCGFKPRFILLKPVGATAYDWTIRDTARSVNNPATHGISPSLIDVENAASTGVDLLSNGFKLRSTSGNYNNDTVVFAAFAESPFKYARAR